MSALPRILCIMGSGETAPTMVTVHADLLERMGPPPVPAVLLDTPFGFQENADEICERATAYFRAHVGRPIEVASFRNRDAASALEYETMLARIAGARYVFAGPGSPTYALRQWRDTAVPAALISKLRDGGCVTFASAAACGLGVCALPVYEVYKVGFAPHWEEGLDILSAVGLRVAVIPHYNNAEGGTHDTRYCYMGERRLRMLESMLPDSVDVLGVDEHTACIFDLDSGTVTVRGRGAVTWRHDGASHRFPTGTVMPISELAAAAGDEIACGGRPADIPAPRDDGDTAQPAEATPFAAEVGSQSRLAEDALRRRDPAGAVAAILAIDTQIHDWAADTLASDEQDVARSALRQLVVRLGELARAGATDPSEHVAPLVERMLTLRQQLRAEGRYDIADRLRDLLVDAGVEVRDSRNGSSWELSSGERSPV